jgi:hypothetical protein
VEFGDLEKSILTKEQEMKNAKKNAKRAMYLAVLGAVVCSSSSAWAAWWSLQDHGPVKVDGGTRIMARSQAGNAWDQWFWQGKSEGMQFQCPRNNATPTCTTRFELGTSRFTSTSHGFSIGGTVGIAGQELTAKYNREWTKSTSTGRGTNDLAHVSRGQFVQPVAVQKRRWTRGVFHGGHFKVQTLPKSTFVNGKLVRYQYNWTWKDVGNWTDNRAVGSPYYTFAYRSSPF